MKRENGKGLNDISSADISSAKCSPQNRTNTRKNISSTSTGKTKHID